MALCVLCGAFPRDVAAIIDDYAEQDTERTERLKTRSAIETVFFAMLYRCVPNTMCDFKRLAKSFTRMSCASRAGYVAAEQTRDILYRMTGIYRTGHAEAFVQSIDDAAKLRGSQCICRICRASLANKHEALKPRHTQTLRHRDKLATCDIVFGKLAAGCTHRHYAPL